MTEVRSASKVLQFKSTLSLAILVLFLALALDTRPRSKLSSKHLPGDDWILQSRTILRLYCMQGRLRARGIVLRTLRIPSILVT